MIYPVPDSFIHTSNYRLGLTSHFSMYTDIWSWTLAVMSILIKSKWSVSIECYSIHQLLYGLFFLPINLLNINRPVSASKTEWYNYNKGKNGFFFEPRLLRYLVVYNGFGWRLQGTCHGVKKDTCPIPLVPYLLYFLGITKFGTVTIVGIETWLVYLDAYRKAILFIRSVNSQG